MVIAAEVNESMQKSSLIRKMFEEGAMLKNKFGADNVYDFSIGNPNLTPPPQFYEALSDTTAACLRIKNHSYMPQPGNPQTRQAVADFVSQEHGLAVTAEDIFMSAGAAGALNTIFKALLDPGDEVLSPAPCFVEYGFYADNYGGTFRTVPTLDDFTLDLAAMERGITQQTKIVIINSPNNPTGQIYSRESLEALGQLLTAKETEYGHPIYLISDEPYRKIVYTKDPPPSVLPIHARSIVVTSHSKDLSIPGERIGYAVLNPQMPSKQDVFNAMCLTARILGHVNAPAFMQQVVAKVQGVTVDVDLYRRKRDLLCEGLASAGYKFNVPPGAFYLFPKSPIPDDLAFTDILKAQRILVVPGSGFMGPGFFRISYCVEDQTIINALPGFKKALEKIK